MSFDIERFHREMITKPDKDVICRLCGQTYVSKWSERPADNAHRKKCSVYPEWEKARTSFTSRYDMYRWLRETYKLTIKETARRLGFSRSWMQRMLKKEEQYGTTR